MAIPHKTAAYTELRKAVTLPAAKESAAQGATRGRRGTQDRRSLRRGGQRHGRPRYVILFAYLALLVGIGFYAQRRKPDVDDYFVAGRRMGPVTIACMWVAAWIGGASIVGTSARVYTQGITGIWYVLGIAIGCTLFGLTVAKRVKQLGDGDRHLTYPDFIERHYDNRTRAVATITTVLAYTAYSAGQFAAAAAILQVLIGWSYGNCLLLAGAIVTLYTAAGGYLAVTYTDRVQVTLVLVGIVAVGIPVAISQAGSWADMRAVLPAAHYDFGAQGWDRVAALVVSMVLSFFVAMDSFSRSFAARDAAAAQRGALLAPVLMLPIALAVAWLGLAAAVLYPDPASSASILATFVLDRFPVGLKGLMVIGILSAVMSVASISVLTASANYARDIHQRYLRPDIQPAAMLRIAHAGLARRRRPGSPARLEDARHHRHPAVRLHAQLGRALPADDRGDVDGPDPGLRRVLEHERVARNRHRLARRGGRRRGRHLRLGSALAGARRFGAAADRPDGRARAVKIVVAEMPEAEGRDLSIERRHLPAGARVETFTFRGDRDALLAACRGADAILTDYVPFDRAVLGGARGLPPHLRHGDGLGLRGRRRRRGARHPRRRGRRVLHGRGRGPHARAPAGAQPAPPRVPPPGAGRAQLALERGAGLEAARRPDARARRLRPHRAGRRPPRARLRHEGPRLRPARGCRRPCGGSAPSLRASTNCSRARTSSACTATWTRAAAGSSIAPPSKR